MAVADPHAALIAYLLGELDDESRGGFESHLEGCAACRADVAELAQTIEHGRAALPGPGAPPVGLADSALGPAAAGRGRSWTARAGDSRRLRALTALGVAVALLIVAIVAIASGGEGEDEPEPEDAASTPSAAPELRAELTGSAGAAMIEIREAESGRAITLSSDEIPAADAGEFYELWFVNDSDTAKRPVRVSAGSFRPSEDGVTDATMTVGVAPSRFDLIEVTRERDRLPNAGGDTVLRLETKGLIQLG